tara:strand:+ start:1376 stop:1948 length:573 start_codon:yes stop_codon:yes gene_type:complete
MNREKISYEITFNKDIFAVVYLDHHGYVDPTATQGTTSTEPGELMVAKGSKQTISEQSFISLLECDGLSTTSRDEYTDLPLCYSYSLKDICNVRKITTWTQVEENWKDAQGYDKDSIIGYKGSINCATQIDDYKTKMHNLKPVGVSGKENHHNPCYHLDRWMEMKDTHTFNTEYGRWMVKPEKKSKKELV